MQYAGFGKRLSSVVLDYFILLPISIFIIWIGSFSKDIQLILIIPHTLLYFVYHIYMNANYGGTIGKLIVGIKIVKLQGDKIKYKEAFLRNIVDLAFGVVIALIQTITLFSISDPSYENLTWIKKSIYLHNSTPAYFGFISVASQVWIWSELVFLLLNKKKRAIHDFIAGTVVIDIRNKEIAHDISVDEKLDTVIAKLEN
jgi:uncharacterized RDD family membrane protein YckC